MIAKFFVPHRDPIKVGELRNVPTGDGRVMQVEVEGIDTRDFNKEITSRVVKVQRPGALHDSRISALPRMSV